MMMNEDNIKEVKTFIKTHFLKSDWKVCKLNLKQLAELIVSASNGIKIEDYELEKLLKEMGYRHHNSTGRYIMRLSDRLIDYAKERMCLLN